MIKRLSRSKSDIENLSKLRTAIPKSRNNSNYKGVVVNKPWGYEYLMLENSDVAVWILFLNYGHKTSMHCHPSKKSSLVTLSGKIILSGLEGWFKLSTGEGVIIDEAVFHSSKAISRDGVFLMEIETPPKKGDLVRLKDEYGRENKGYEGKDQISSLLHKYEYVDFHNLSKSSSKTVGNCKLSLFSYKNNQDIGQILKGETGHLICLLKGQLQNFHELILATGEVALLSEIKNKSEIFATSDIMYFTILQHGFKKER